MRADVTDMPGYWDSVVDSPPERREWYEICALAMPTLIPSQAAETWLRSSMVGSLHELDQEDYHDRFRHVGIPELPLA